jgi:hypothetical protein
LSKNATKTTMTTININVTGGRQAVRQKTHQGQGFS